MPTPAQMAIQGYSLTGVPAEAVDVHAPAAATVATLAFAAEAGYRWCLAAILHSYDAAPTGGLLQAWQTDAGGTNEFLVHEQSVPAAGPGAVQFAIPKTFAENKGFRVSLTSGGGSVVGKLSVSKGKMRA